MTQNQQISAIVLAAGKGTRLNCVDRPKVMFEVGGKPIIYYVVKSLRQAGIQNIVVVVGFHGQQVIDYLNKNFRGLKYAWQIKRLGTGHAVMQAEKHLVGKSGMTIICNGDHPLFTAGTFRRMAAAYQQDGNALVILTVVTMRHHAFGRVIRDREGNVIEVVELKSCTPAQEKIRERNVGVYAADNSWLWPALKKIKKNLEKGEYYVTDLVEIAIKEGKKVGAVAAADPKEAYGINTHEELEQVERVLTKKS